MSKLKLRLKEMGMVASVYFAKAFRAFFPKGHWVIVERGTDAQDNGFRFYEYMKKNHPEKRVYYVIDRNSPDFEKVRGDAAPLGSFKNYWTVATAERILSTHYGSALPLRSSRFFKLFRLHRNYCFLQHGITYNNQTLFHRKNAPMKLLFCGAKPEYDYILQNFGHPESVVRYTGFARFDALHDQKPKRQILVMPTWRKYLRHASEEEFLKSDYYRRFQALLADEALLSAMRQSGIRLVFYLHHEMQRFSKLFRAESESVSIVRAGECAVQTLLMESAVLITDYSSVFFDFAYMRKPCLYYQFDYDSFYGKHYEKGNFDYEADGFGACVSDGQALIEALKKLIQNDMQPEEKYLDRMNAYFPLYDRMNCERIYREIIRE